MTNVNQWTSDEEKALPRRTEKYFYPNKRCKVLKFEFLLFLITKRRETQISKLDIS